MGLRPKPIYVDLFAVALSLWFSYAYSSGTILNNYVGRQVPTAMVARNLDRGSGFLHPQLDTGPFPNLFLVEPPVYAGLAVSIRRITRLPLETSGKILSAIGLALAAWGLIGLDRRRFVSPFASEGPRVFSFFILPICWRYGTDFQPDVLALGLMLSGLRLWDDYEIRGNRWEVVAAWSLVTTSLATKILMVYALVPLILAILQPRTRKKIFLTLSTLLPTMCWYLYSLYQMRTAEGSRASVDNAEFWLKATTFGPLLRIQTYKTIAYIVIWRAYTPVGILLSLSYLLSRRFASVRLWKCWGISACLMLLVASGKLHHEYYFLALAPVVAIGVSRGLILLGLFGESLGYGWSLRHPSKDLLPPRHRRLGDLLAKFRVLWTEVPQIFAVVVFLAFWVRVMDLRARRDGPPEWAAWPLAVEAIHKSVPRGTLLAAPEALIYLADRKGCRLEYETKSRLRAAGEWSATIDPADPLALVELYRSKGAKYVADLWPVGDEPDRRLLHEAIRRRYNVIMDRDGVLLAELVDRRE